MRKINRRDFLKLLAMGAAGLALMNFEEIGEILAPRKFQIAKPELKRSFDLGEVTDIRFTPWTKISSIPPYGVDPATGIILTLYDPMGDIEITRQAMIDNIGFLPFIDPGIEKRISDIWGKRSDAVLDPVKLEWTL